MKLIPTLALAAILAIPAMAQQPVINQTQEQSEALKKADWFVPLNYGGFDFEIPAGCIVEKNSKILVKYPDGTFGISMENEGIAANQKIAFEKARMYAKRYNLTDAKCNKLNIGGVDGAKAEGTLENMKVTILILPVGDQQVTTVIMATPNRENWANHFISSMKR